MKNNLWCKSESFPFNSIFLSIALFILCYMSGYAQTRVWNQIMTGYANTPIMKVTRVAIYTDRTELTLHLDFTQGQWVAIAPNTVIKADGKDFTVKEATILTLGERFTMPQDTLDFVLTFDPIPTDTKRIDLMEPDGWQVLNIREAGLIPEGLTDTYWRDETSGDWLIGFTSKQVIFDNQIWDIISQKEKKGGYEILLNKGKTIKVGKMKKGLRTIVIDSQTPVVCSPIITPALPDYPTKDTRRGFIDNGYSMTDSITIVGWLKDMPQGLWKKERTFFVEYEDIITNKQESVFTETDSLGRFSFKIPLINSMEVFIDWEHSSVNAFFEPGKTYFFLHDFITGQKLWMGDDVRVQNEMLAHPRSRAEAKLQDGLEFQEYRLQSDSARQVQMDHLRLTLKNHSTLSQRYTDYMNNYYHMLQGRNLTQARYYTKGHNMPKEYLDYVCNEFWKRAPKPYTLYRDFIVMNNNLLNELVTKRNEDITTPITRLEKEGKVVLTDEEKAALDAFPATVKQVQDDFQNAKDENERKAVVEAFNSSKMVSVLNALFDRNQELMEISSFEQVLQVVDSIGCDKNLRDIILAQRLYQQINVTRQPVSPAVMQFAESEIQLPAALTMVKSLNDKYLAIIQRDISDSPSLKSNDALTGMSEGESILKKIIEPYRGRIILLDIWGTWCSPCKEALSHSAEEYERLKDYDMVFLYLANRSDDESWKNVIKEFDILGDNVVHYNLPQEQQDAVEQFLNVQYFPTYRLIDRDGRVLDVNADPRNLERLVMQLDQIK